MTSVTLDEPTSTQRAGVKRAAQHKEGRVLAKIVSDRRLYRRVPIRVFGRFMSQDKQEHPCQVINMSAGGMALLSTAICQPNERIVAYLDQFGRVEGTVARVFEGGFAVHITASAYKREKIANLLTWLINQESLGLMEERRHERVVPRNTSSKLILPNGEVHDCRIIDVSLSGASIATDLRLPTETIVILGRMRGRIVRHHDQGFAIQFCELQDPDSLARSFG